jgi:hypothetical protein
VLNATSLTPKFLPNGNDDLIIFSSNYEGAEKKALSYNMTNRSPFSLFIANQQQKGNANANKNNVKMVGFNLTGLKCISNKFEIPGVS